jgi:hypothetical protein
MTTQSGGTVHHVLNLGLRGEVREYGRIANTSTALDRKDSLIEGFRVRSRLFAGGNRIRTCMGLFLSSSRFWSGAGSLFGAGKPFFVPSPAIRFAERAGGVKGPKR